MYDVQAYFSSSNYIKQNGQIMNEDLSQNFKLKLNKKKDRFSVNMETIDEEDTLTLKISKPEGNDLTPIGEIQINILDLFTNKKKKYLIGNNASITLKIKYQLQEDDLKVFQQSSSESNADNSPTAINMD